MHICLSVQIHIYIYIDICIATNKDNSPFTMAGLTVENPEANTAEEITSYHQRMEPSGSLQEGSGEHRVGALRGIFCLHKVLLKDVSSQKRGDLS